MEDMQDFVTEEILTEERELQGQRVTWKQFAFYAIAALAIMVLGCATIKQL